MLQKRIDHGSNGYNVPFIPKARRSFRKRGLVRPEDDNQMSAFDLLATVAGELLQGESSEDACLVKDRSVNVENAENREHDDVEERYKIPDLNEIVEQGDDDDDKSLSENEELNIAPKISPAMVTLGSNTRGSISSSRGNNNVRVFSRDDGENTYVCRQPSTITTVRARSRIGDRRIRRILASKYWRVAPVFKNRDLFDTELCSVYRRRTFGYKHKRSRRIYSFKNRSLCYKSFPNSSKKFNDMTASRFSPVGNGVKLRIKSFRVPEFVVEMPETATVGSLKRSVMEAVKALVRDGLRIGVVVKGKKIRDDNRTLLQSGISLGGKMGSLGFTLEPDSSYANVPISSEDNSLVLSIDRTEPLSRAPATSIFNRGVSHESSYNRVTNMGNVIIESDHDSVPSRGERSTEKVKDDSGALVALVEGTPQMLPVVPVTQKSTEIAQRRIRRPFSVAEVEALVQAVEELGTGRWRDVKQHAFSDVNYRTYVDLKDKWKTLVHTARISPQQRRGQPVPQQLLERVLAIHEFWSKQPKHHPNQARDLL